MNSESELIKKILLEIKKNPEQKEKIIHISGYDYNSKVFPNLLSFYNDGYIFAVPLRDETKNIVQLFVNTLTPKGEKYLKELNGTN
ncbi:MAG: hypothetical protein WCS69_08125 [Ignavibacteriaceae bacterium]|jgi:hypothetical protein